LSSVTSRLDALWLQLLLEPAGDLCRQPFLDLEVAAEVLDATELAQADDPCPGQIADVRDTVEHTVERKEVMHAQRVERNRARDDQLVVAIVIGKGGRAERLRREQLGVGVGDPARRLLQRPA
jgi:hypothetical protein